MQPIFIPTLSFWENGNTWYGSLGEARFYLAPEDKTLTAQLWRGPLTKEFSAILAKTSVSLSQEGLSELTRWLENQAFELNTSPENTL